MAGGHGSAVAPRRRRRRQGNQNNPASRREKVETRKAGRGAKGDATGAGPEPPRPRRRRSRSRERGRRRRGRDEHGARDGGRLRPARRRPTSRTTMVNRNSSTVRAKVTLFLCFLRRNRKSSFACSANERTFSKYNVVVLCASRKKRSGL